MIGDNALGTFDGVAERLDDAAVLAGERTLATVHVGTLHRDEHGVLTIAEVVALDKGVTLIGSTDAVLGVAVEVVVVDVDAHGTDARMA